MRFIEYTMIKTTNYQQNNSGASNPFQSFWMGGFECTDQMNAFGNRVDFLHLTGHLQLIDQDYQIWRLLILKRYGKASDGAR